MNLLILTQKVDLQDDVLGFMHDWILEFAKHCEKLTIICLFKGKYQLPVNVKVLSLGKETGRSRLKYLFNFYRYIWQERKNYQTVFVHMNYEYVVLGGLFWRLWGKKISLWYAHGHVPFLLKPAERLANIVFTSTQSGFRMPSKKLKVVGQGIDINRFKAQDTKPETNQNIFRIVTIGRISPVKDYEVLIEAIDILNRQKKRMKVDIIGGIILPEEEQYLKSLKQKIKQKQLENIINFVGPVANKDIVNYLRPADLFVNMSQTGSLDKALVEAMACELPILTCNEAILEVLTNYQDTLIYPKGDYKELAKRIRILLNTQIEERRKIGKNLREIVVNKHSLEGLITKLINFLKV